MKKLPGIRNVIFDLGGVIVDLNVDKTIQLFADLSGKSHDEVDHLYYSSPEFIAYEKGLISDKDFRNAVRSLLAISASDLEVDACWNAMILGLPANKLDLLLNVKNNYQTFLLSNTNAIHIEHVNGVMLPPHNQKPDLEDYFHRAYYSHTMHMRKPDAEIFTQVLADSSLDPAETVFLDDNKANVEGARQVGIQAVLVDTPSFVLDFFA